MAFTAGFSVNVGDPTKASDVDVLAANDDYLKNAIDTFIANDANNRVLTATGSGTANAESNLTFDGSTLTVTGTVSATTFSGNVTGNLTGDVTGNISGNVTGGTISGTTGTFSGDLTVDTSTLKVDSSNNRVGVLCTNPNYPLTVQTASNHRFFIRDSSTSAGSEIQLQAGNDADTATTNLKLTASRYFLENGALGLGLAPTVTMHSNNSKYLELPNNVFRWSRSTGSYQSSNFYYNSSDTGVFAANGYGLVHSQNTSGGAYYWNITTASNSSGAGATASLSTKMYLDSTGLGIGTDSPVLPLQLLNYGGLDGNANQLIIRNNLYYDTVDARSESIKAGYATEIYLNNADGSMTFRTSSSAATGANEALSTTERARIDSSGNFGIGTTSPRYNLAVKGNNSTAVGIAVDNDSGSSTLDISALGSTYNAHGAAAGEIWFYSPDNINIGGATGNTNDIKFLGNGSERARITSAGSVGIGQSSPSGRLHVEGGGIYHIGSSLKYIASSSVQSISSTNNAGAELTTDAYLWINRSSAPCVFLNRTTTTGQIAVFYSDLTAVGSISVTASATAYNTSSDYRLKENLAPITGAVDRVNALQPRRFNFISDPDTTVDGFLAHEVSDIVPEAITGEKDAVDADGNPEYQGIDQSKLVPLLTAAIQELTARIEALEAA